MAVHVSSGQCTTSFDSEAFPFIDLQELYDTQQKNYLMPHREEKVECAQGESTERRCSDREAAEFSWYFWGRATGFQTNASVMFLMQQLPDDFVLVSSSINFSSINRNQAQKCKDVVARLKLI